MNAVCRLCGTDKNLCDVFNTLQSVNPDLIWLATGVDIKETDISKMVCQRCRAIAIKQHKYRKNAINNDRILKEACGQPYEPPPTEREDIEKLHSELIKELFTPSAYVGARKMCHHPSVTKIYKLYKNIILPNDISNSDVFPAVSIDSSEVTDWYEEQALKSSSKIDSILNQETSVIALKETARKKTHSHNGTRKRSSSSDEDKVPNKKCKTSNESDSLGPLDTIVHLPEDIAEEYFFMDSENIMSSGMLLPAHLCTHCNKWFDTYIELMKHQKAHLICKFCKMKLQNLELLHQHQRELCYINITKSLPTIPLIKIDSVPSVAEKYPNAFLELPTINSEDEDEDEDVDIPSALIMKDNDDDNKATEPLIKLPDIINKRFARIRVDKSLSEEEMISLLFNKYFIPKDKSLQTNFTPNNKIYCSTSNYIEVHDLKLELEKYKIPIVFKCNRRISANFEESLSTSSRPVVYNWENKKVFSIRKSNKASVIIDLSNDDGNKKVVSIRKNNTAGVVIDLSNDENFKTKTANNSILFQHITDNKVGGSSNKKSSHPLINRFDKNSLPRLKCTFTQASRSNTNTSYVQPVNPTTNSVGGPPQLLYYSLPGKQPHFIGQPHTTQNSTIQSNGAQSYNFFQVLPNSTLFSDLTQANTNITQPSSTSTSSQSNIQDSSIDTFIQFLNSPNLLSYFPTQPATQLNQLDHNQQPPINVTGNINNNILLLAPAEPTSNRPTIEMTQLSHIQQPIDVTENINNKSLVLAPAEPTSSNQTTIEMTQLNHIQQPINVTENINNKTLVLAPAEPTSSNQTTTEKTPSLKPCHTKVRIKSISELK